MKSIKVTFRAIFSGPVGVLNQMGCKVPGTFPVEVFGHGDKWQAREIASPARQIYKKLGTLPGHDIMKSVVESAFTTMVERWQPWAWMPVTDGSALCEDRILQPYEFRAVDGRGFYLFQPEDFTHINPQHGAGVQPGKIFGAACGARVPAKVFISTKANIEPTCRACAEVWRREYKGK